MLSTILLAALLLLPASGGAAETDLILTDQVPAKPKGNNPSEPLADSLSLARAADYLDGTTVAWINERKCASCHTGFLYLLARSKLERPDAPAVLRIRKFYEERVLQWDEGGKGAGYLVGKGRVKVSEGVTEVVGLAASLAMHDRTTGKLHPLTRRALDRMWELQREDGSWEWNRTGLAPLESDEYFGVLYAAVGVGSAPEAYAGSPAAQAGVNRLREYFRAHPPSNLHHKLWLLWASTGLDGLVTSSQREAWLTELRPLQRTDGGWSLHSLGDWPRRDLEPVDKQAPSDGYATGLVVYVLRQLQSSSDTESIRRGVDWLKSNQRQSGRWFTRSANWDRGHFICAAGTALAVLAIDACTESAK